MTRQIEAIGTRVRLSERVAESRSIRLEIVDHREHLAELFPSAGQLAGCDQIVPPGQMKDGFQHLIRMSEQADQVLAARPILRIEPVLDRPLVRPG